MATDLSEPPWAAAGRATPPPPPGTIDLDAESELELELELEPPAPPPRRVRRALPWLLALLVGAGWAASFTRGLHEEEAARALLRQARDEAAEQRRDLFRVQATLAAERAARRDEVASLSAAVAQHGSEKSETEKLIAELRAQLDGKTGEVSSNAREISVNLVDQILFKSGEAELSPSGKEVLRRVGGVLKTVKDKQVLIGGHTDSKPIHTARFASNWELSAARAVNVVRYLAETAGVDPARLTAAGLSQFHPRASDLAQNRRIEILLTPVLDKR